MVDPVALLAALPRDTGAVAVRDGDRTIVAAAPDEVVRASGADALERLDRLGPGWWAGWLAYDLGRAVERVVPRGRDDLGIPDVVLARFAARAVIDPAEQSVTVVGEGPGRHLLEEAVAAVRRDEVDGPGPPDLTTWTSGIERRDYEAAVRAVVELIGAGDCYQVNLTRRLTCERAADPLALFASLAARHPAPHGAFVRLDDVGIVSASPERFLRREGARVETRPIKGTDRNADRLVASAKDRAENVMIVDLARNDLGRVCEFGSIEVPALCELEAHPGLFHLVSTVRGRLRGDVGTGELIRATFAPASVTGAPKPRVMQVIEDLEPVRRGVYCGAIGWIDTEREALDLNVAIRTFTIAGGHTMLGVGGGVVADSDPRREWDETELKAERLLAAAGAGQLVGAR